MRFAVAIMVLLLAPGLASAQPPPNPYIFCVGIYADATRTLECVDGPAGTVFERHAWAWIPEGEELAYITLRFDVPENLDLSARPSFHELVIELIITEFGDHDIEWNMLMVDCPSGWIEVFTQTCVIVDDQPATARIAAEHSMMRSCEFVLHDLEVLNDLGVNDPGCSQTPTDAATWGAVKKLYR